MMEGTNLACTVGLGWAGQLICQLRAGRERLVNAAFFDWLVACMLACLLAQPAFATTCLGSRGIVHCSARQAHCEAHARQAAPLGGRGP